MKKRSTADEKRSQPATDRTLNERGRGARPSRSHFGASRAEARFWLGTRPPQPVFQSAADLASRSSRANSFFSPPAMHRIKFLTVRNLISPTRRAGYKNPHGVEHRDWPFLSNQLPCEPREFMRTAKGREPSRHPHDLLLSRNCRRIAHQQQSGKRLPQNR